MHYGFAIKPNRCGNRFLNFLGCIGVITRALWTFLTLFLNWARASLLLYFQQQPGAFGNVGTSFVNVSPPGPCRRLVEEQRSWLWSSSRSISKLQIWCNELLVSSGHHRQRVDTKLTSMRPFLRTVRWLGLGWWFGIVLVT